ncbi:MAG: GGDEF domain-containing protein [Roseburia sp.]|nr:GGDEF domain-containing protein [Roseburia sp.]
MKNISKNIFGNKFKKERMAALFKRYISAESFRYKLIIYAITSVHVVLVLLFSLLRIWPMILFNIGSVATYLYCVHIIKSRGSMIKVFYVTYVEIIVHSFVATICIGWRFGFPQYIIGLIPFGYYMCYTLMNDSRKYFIATVLSIAAFFAFIGCRSISMYAGSIYELEVSAGAELAIYIFNTICNFGFLLLVTFVFVMEMHEATSKLRSQNAILDKLASIDPLTGLYNRRSMQVFLNHALEAEEDFCLVMCDIDNFKKVNDTYGHDFGDVVLKDIAKIVQQQVKDHGHVCRWGGEEILILSNDRLDHTCDIAESIRRNVEHHLFCFQDKFIHCSLTLGIAAHRIGNTVEDTITHADSRLYYGKQHGKNRVVSSYDTP